MEDGAMRFSGVVRLHLTLKGKGWFDRGDIEALVEMVKMGLLKMVDMGPGKAVRLLV